MEILIFRNFSTTGVKWVAMVTTTSRRLILSLFLFFVFCFLFFQPGLCKHLPFTVGKQSMILPLHYEGDSFSSLKKKKEGNFFFQMQRFSLIQHTLKSQTQPFEPGRQMLAHTRWWLFGGSASPPPSPWGFLSISLGLALASQWGTLIFSPPMNKEWPVQRLTAQENMKNELILKNYKFSSKSKYMF